jgi:hypothetical protein
MDIIMKFKTLLTINSVLAFATGLACVLMPAQLLANYGVKLPSMGLVIYQFWGVALIGIGMLSWFVREINELTLQRKIAIVLLITNGLSSLIAVRGQYAGANSSGWSTVVIFFILALSYGVFLLINTNFRKANSGL